MPEKFTTFGITYDTDDGYMFKFTGIEYYECPQCRYRIPIKEEHVDYRILYERLRECAKLMRINFLDTLKEIEDEIPEAHIYMHNKRAELNNLLNDLINKLKGND